MFEWHVAEKKIIVISTLRFRKENVYDLTVNITVLINQEITEKSPGGRTVLNLRHFIF